MLFRQGPPHLLPSAHYGRDQELATCEGKISTHLDAALGGLGGRSSQLGSAVALITLSHVSRISLITQDIYLRIEVQRS
jgi:hypothetical protein